MFGRPSASCLSLHRLVVASASILALAALAGRADAAAPKARLLLELPYGLSEVPETRLQGMKVQFERRLEDYRKGRLKIRFEAALPTTHPNTDAETDVPDDAYDLLLPQRFSWMKQERETRYFVLGRSEEAEGEVTLFWQLVDVNENWDDVKDWRIYPTHHVNFVTRDRDEQVENARQIVQQVIEYAPGLAEEIGGSMIHKIRLRLWCFVGNEGFRSAIRLDSELAPVMEDLLPQLPGRLYLWLREKGVIERFTAQATIEEEVEGCLNSEATLFRDMLIRSMNDHDILVYGYIGTVDEEGRPKLFAAGAADPASSRSCAGRGPDPARAERKPRRYRDKSSAEDHDRAG
jgi:hypothetical protein